SEHHPRRRTDLRGHQSAEETLLRQLASRRMHHAWLFAGLRGIGKAPLAHRIAARAHADLITLERSYDAKAERLKSEIVVDDVRKASGFFARTAGEGGWRICIVDAA